MRVNVDAVITHPAHNQIAIRVTGQLLPNRKLTGVQLLRDDIDITEIVREFNPREITETFNIAWAWFQKQEARP